MNGDSMLSWGAEKALLNRGSLPLYIEVPLYGTLIARMSPAQGRNVSSGGYFRKGVSPSLAIGCQKWRGGRGGGGGRKWGEWVGGWVDGGKKMGIKCKLGRSIPPPPLTYFFVQRSTTTRFRVFLLSL